MGNSCSNNDFNVSTPDFHCTLAISASYVDFFQRKPGISSKTLHHISQAYSLVNEKLSGPDCVSDRAIAAVISLTIYQQIHGLQSIGLIHLNGLYRMVHLRGGIAKLMQEHRALALKSMRSVLVLAFPALFSPSCSLKVESLTVTRLDVEMALQTGSPTLFCSDALEPTNTTADESRFTHDQVNNTCADLTHIMLSVLSFTSLLNCREQEGHRKLDPLSYTEMLVSLLYRLIEVAPLGQQRSGLGKLYDNSSHLTMLAFMTTLLPEYSRGHCSQLLSNRLQSAIQNLHFTSIDTQDSGSPLRLWTLFIGGISVLKQYDHRRSILEACERLDLHDWPAVRCQLCVFPWINALHDAPSRSLWENIQREKHEI